MCLRRLVCKLRMETPDVTIKFLMFSKVGELLAMDHVQSVVYYQIEATVIRRVALIGRSKRVLF